MDVAAGVIYKKINGYAWYRYAFVGAVGEHAYRIKSYKYHHDLAPNIRKKNNAVWGGKIHTVNTNSLGFKDDAVTDIPLRSHKQRMIFIGDSFTEGVGQDYENTFVGIIEKEMGRDYSILNAGVSSYSPIIYWKKIDYLINDVNLKFDELIVYLDISDIQDEATEYKLNNDGSVGNIDWIPTLPELIKENTILLAYIRSFRERNKAQELIDSAGNNSQQHTYKDAINRHRSLWTIDDEVFHEYGKLGLQVAEKHMDKLFTLLQKNNIKMTLAVYPWPDQVYYDTTSSKQVTHWRTWAQNHHVQFIDHFKDFFKLKEKIGSKNIIEKYYVPGDVHFNAQGNVLIAEQFLRQYRN